MVFDNSRPDHNMVYLVKLEKIHDGQKCYAIVFSDQGWQVRENTLNREFGSQWLITLLGTCKMDARRVVESDVHKILRGEGLSAVVIKPSGAESRNCYRYTQPILRRILEVLEEKAVGNTIDLRDAGWSEVRTGNPVVSGPGEHQRPQDLTLVNKWLTLFGFLGLEAKPCPGQEGVILTLDGWEAVVKVSRWKWAVWTGVGDSFEEEGPFFEVGENMRFNEGVPIFGLVKEGGEFTILRRGDQWSCMKISEVHDGEERWVYEDLYNLGETTGIVCGY